jgi:hypothetical protein
MKLFKKKLVSTYESTRRHNPEHHHLKKVISIELLWKLYYLLCDGYLLTYYLKTLLNNAWSNKNHKDPLFVQELTLEL